MEFLIAIIVAFGAGMWVYGKLMRSSGNNTKNSLIVAGITGFAVFVVLFMLARTFLPS